MIALWDAAREVRPELEGREPIHWSVPDPSGTGASEDGARAALERVADERETRIRTPPFSTAREEAAAGAAASAG